MYSNGVLICFETIIKHEKDKDNPIFAFKKVAENCMKHINNEWLRQQVRNELNKALKI